MERRNWIITVITILALGGGGYGACVAMTDGADEGLTAGDMDDPTVADPGVEPPPYEEGDAGAPEIDPPDPEAAEVPTDDIEGVPGREMDTPEAQAANVPQDELQGVDRESLRQACGDRRCAVGERCCHATARCYPVDCQDCCDAELNPPTEDPRLTDDEPGPVR